MEDGVAACQCAKGRRQRGAEGMIWNLDIVWLSILISCVTIIGFIFALALDAIMRRDGFGPVGNTFVLTGGFFLTIFAFNMMGHRMNDLHYAAVAGLVGAFVCVVVLAIGKALLNRL
jgi:hypothetical protein